jgi:DNA-binding NtrC family response regulator
VTGVFPRGQANSRNSLLLVVGAVEADDRQTDGLVTRLPWHTHYARSISEALPFVCQDLARVVLCEHALPDGTWKDVLQLVASRNVPPPVIVTSRHANNYLWAEVLNLGGYDVLATPLEPAEALRSISLAWQRWETHYKHASPAERARSAKRGSYV